MIKEKLMEIAQAYVDDMNKSNPEEKWLANFDTSIERAYGWFVDYNSEKYYQTGELEYLILGTSPFFIDKETGHIIDVYFPLDKNDEEVIKTFEKEYGYK